MDRQQRAQRSERVQRIERIIERKPKSPPRREAITKQLDEHTNRIKQLMQRDYLLLQQQNTELRIKCKKVGELQQKVQLVLKNNEELFIENQKLAKLLEEKIQQCEMLKKKAQVTKKNKEELNEYERKKLILEVQRLQKEIEEVQHLKSLTIKQIRTKHQIEIQNLLMENEKGMKLFEEQLIKLKDQSDKKDLQINMLQVKLRKLQADNQFESTELKQERLKLKEQLRKLEPYKKLYEQIKDQYQKLREDKKKQDQINSLKLKQLNQKNRFDFDRLKKQLSQRVNQLEQQNQGLKQKLKEAAQKNKYECDKLKAEFNDRIAESEEQNEALVTKIKKMEKKGQEYEKNAQINKQMKQQFESNEQKLRKQIDSLKNKIKQLDIINDKQIEAIHDKFEALRQQELAEIKASHEQYKAFMEEQIAKLQQVLRIKDNEFDYLLEEKSTMKQMFIEEGNQMKNQLILLQNQYRETQLHHEEEVYKLKEQIKKLEQQLMAKMRKMEQEHLNALKKKQVQSNAHIQRLQNDIMNNDKQKRKVLEDLNKKTTQCIAYKEIIDNQKDQIKQNNRKADEKEKAMKKSQQEWKKSCFDLKNRSEKQQQQWNQSQKEAEQINLQKQKQLISKIKQKERQIQNLERQNQSIKQFVGNRDKNLQETQKKMSQLNKVILDRQQTIDSLRNQIVTQAQKSSSKAAYDKKQIEEYYENKINFISQDQQTKIFLLQAKVQQLTIQLKQKQHEIDQLLRQYKKMREEMIVLSEQDANKREVTLKFPGATADLIATKNMFDVFIKSKVLQYSKQEGIWIQNKENSEVKKI